ncbi:DUF4225 domain-containing protein [Rahnella laticis]|uniref:DUF4225 domain-containing protein n=1 Tax=Rahnella laticis TaxID=2787622 RepID=UPI0018A29FAD|nr:DUF4225 domain-containing protein [Rahnella laticis]MBF7996393.1 DUF4225 domain-containing protein [Rahnella laticis]
MIESNKIQLKLKSDELTQLVRFLSYDYLSSYRSKLEFRKMVSDFIERVLYDVETNCLTNVGGIQKIQAEIDSLKNQSRQIQNQRVEQYAAVKLKKKNNEVNVLLAQAGFVGGGTQIYTGFDVCLASLGTRCKTWGIPLITHGVNNMYENGYYLLFRKNSPGWIRDGYRKIAVSAGAKEDVGDYAYAILDLGLSAYGVAGKIIKPREKSWKLWTVMNNDWIYGWQDMGVIPLLTEAGVDSATIYSSYSQFKQIRVGNSFDNH